MKFMLLHMHILCMSDSLVTVLDENVKVKELLVLNLLQAALDLLYALFKHFRNKIIDCVLLNTEVRSKFEL